LTISSSCIEKCFTAKLAPTTSTREFKKHVVFLRALSAQSSFFLSGAKHAKTRQSFAGLRALRGFVVKD
jgi:hypothetical protein